MKYTKPDFKNVINVIEHKIDEINEELENLKNDIFLNQKNVDMFKRLYEKHMRIRQNNQEKEIDLEGDKLILTLVKLTLEDNINSNGESLEIDEDYLNDILNEYIFYRK